MTPRAWSSHVQLNGHEVLDAPLEALRAGTLSTFQQSSTHNMAARISMGGRTFTSRQRQSDPLAVEIFDTQSPGDTPVDVVRGDERLHGESRQGNDDAIQLAGTSQSRVPRENFLPSTATGQDGKLYGRVDGNRDALSVIPDGSAALIDTESVALSRSHSMLTQPPPYER